MIEITREARHRGCFDQLQRELLLGLHRQRTQSQYHRVSLQRLSQFIPPGKCWRPAFFSPSFVYLDDCMVRATAISMRSGTVASRVTRPINSREPQTISTTPTNGAMTCGQGMPMFTKRPTPRESGNKNFCTPSERKTQPTS